MMQRKVNNRFLIVGIFMLGTTIGYAAAPDLHHVSKDDNGLKGSVKFGMVANSGNSRTKDISGGLELRYIKDKWRFGVESEGEYSTDRDTKTAANFSVLGDMAYYFLPRHYLFGKAEYDYDDFSPYKYVTTLIGGYGWKPIDNKKVELRLEAGPGWRRQKEATSEKIDTDIIIYGGGFLTWHITDTADFTQRLLFRDGSRNTYTESRTALKTKVIGHLSLEASYTVKHNSKIPKLSTNRHRTDTVTKLQLVYVF